jgi:CheY-like chemotaxis protein
MLPICLAELLEDAGHSVAVAYDGPSALQAAAQLKPEIMFIDIGLPLMDGCELAQRLKAIQELGETRLFVLTGYGQATDRKRALEAVSAIIWSNLSLSTALSRFLTQVTLISSTSIWPMTLPL